MATVTGGSGNDSITTSTGNDSISGNGGNDTINSGSGNDTVYGGDGADLIYLGDGADRFGDWETDAGNDTVYGAGGADSLNGGTGDDMIFGEAGNDTLTGGTGNDYLSGGIGADDFYITDDHATDVIDGGETGTDWDSIWFANYASQLGITVSFSGTGAGAYDFDGTTSAGQFSGIEAIGGTAYADLLDASADTGGMDLYGLAGNDSLTGGSGSDYLEGGSGNDTLTGGAGWDEFSGGAGNDSMSGGADGDIFWIGANDGSDTVTGGEAGADQDVLALSGSSTQGFTVAYSGSEGGSYSSSAGGSGQFSQIEEIQFGSGNDNLVGSASSSAIVASGGGGADTLRGGSGNDWFSGGTGDDRLYGEAGSDTLDGGDAADWLDGGSASDSLSGGAGNDTLLGGTGNDTLTGGTGTDVFVLGAAGGADRITDFATTLVGGTTLDRLDVSGLTNAAGGPIRIRDVTVSAGPAGEAILSFPNGESVTLDGVTATQAAQPGQLAAMGIPCFVSGTLILTDRGERPVEEIRGGDIVLTRDGAMPVLWSGWRTVSADDLAALPGLRPILIPAGAIGNRRDLRVSPRHAFAVRTAAGPALVRARHLATLSGPVRDDDCLAAVTYHHILTPRHAILFAEGAGAESFYPGPRALAGLHPRDRDEVVAAVARLAGIDPGHLTPGTAVDVYGPLCAPALTGRQARLQARELLRRHGREQRRARRAARRLMQSAARMAKNGCSRDALSVIPTDA